MIPNTVKIYLCLQPIDMRRSFDALALAARERAGVELQAGVLFCFVGKTSKRLKLLWAERHGYCILYKRLHGARFVLTKADKADNPVAMINSEQLAELLVGTPWSGRIKKVTLH
jgi:transposase